LKGTLTILLLLLTLYLRAQQPAILSMEGIGGNGYEFIFPHVTKTTDNGGIIWLKTTSDQGSGNIYSQCNQTSNNRSTIFRKYTSTGDIEWEKCYPYFTQDSEFVFLNPIVNGDYILVGRDNSPDRQFLIRREDAAGSIIWGSKSYGGSGGDLLVDVKATADGGYLLVGETNSNDGDVGFHYGSMFSLDIWLVKLDSNGNKLWSTVIGGTDDEYPFCIVPGEDGCYILGRTLSTDYDCISNHGGMDILVARIDDSGQILWTKCYGGSSNDGYEGGWAINHGDKGLLISTDISSGDGDVSIHFGNHDIWLASIDSNSILSWEKSFGTAGLEVASAMDKSTDGTVWIAGQSALSAWVVHTDSFGNLLNSKLLNGNGSCEGKLILPLAGGVVLTGGTYDAPGPGGGEFPDFFHGLYDVFLTKFAPWTTSIDAAQKKSGITIYPNPAETDLQIGLGEYQGSLEIRDITGKLVYKEKEVKSSSHLDVGDWGRGAYYLQVVSTSGEAFYRLIVLQ
jgi:hypothetical protein